MTSPLSSLALLPTTINGVEYAVHPEYTQGPIGQDFLDSLGVFNQIFNLRDPDVKDPDPQVVIDAINLSTLNEDLEAALWGGEVTREDGTPVNVQGLITLAKEGMADDDGIVYFLTVQMAGAVDKLIQSLKAAGVQIQVTATDIPRVTIEAQDILNWRNLAVSSDVIRQILQDALDIGAHYNRSFQALVELVYVRTGNELLSENLERLEEALSTTKGTLETLNNLQDLHNNITAKGKGSFEEFAEIAYGRTLASRFVRGGNTGSAESRRGIAKWGELFFTEIDPNILNTVTEANKADFLRFRNELNEQIDFLETNTPNLDDPETVPGTLFSKLQKVRDDIEAALNAAGEDNVDFALINWILDSYSKKTPLTEKSVFLLDAYDRISRNLTSSSVDVEVSFETVGEFNEKLQIDDIDISLTIESLGNLNLSVTLRDFDEIIDTVKEEITEGILTYPARFVGSSQRSDLENLMKDIATEAIEKEMESILDIMETAVSEETLNPNIDNGKVTSESGALRLTVVRDTSDEVDAFLDAFALDAFENILQANFTVGPFSFDGTDNTPRCQ